jgi:hypothetical protein
VVQRLALRRCCAKCAAHALVLCQCGRGGQQGPQLLRLWGGFVATAAAVLCCVLLQAKDSLTASDVVNNVSGRSERSKVHIAAVLGLGLGLGLLVVGSRSAEWHVAVSSNRVLSSVTPSAPLWVCVCVCLLTCLPAPHPAARRRAQVRTSTGTFFDNAYDDVISKIEERVAIVTMLPRGGCARARAAAPSVTVQAPGVRTARHQRVRAHAGRRSCRASRADSMHVCVCVCVCCAAGGCREPGGPAGAQVCGRPEVRATVSVWAPLAPGAPRAAAAWRMPVDCCSALWALPPKGCGEQVLTAAVTAACAAATHAAMACTPAQLW